MCICILHALFGPHWFALIALEFYQKVQKMVSIDALAVHSWHFFSNSSQEKKSSHLFRCWSKLGGTSTTGTFSGTQLWVWQRCDLFNYWPTYLSLWPRYNHPTVATILEENGALDCNWPPHSMIRGVEMKTSGAQCYKLMWSFCLSKQIK